MIKVSDNYWKPTSLSPSLQALGDGEIDLWRVDLKLDTECNNVLFKSLLSQDERTRADRYVFPKDRNQFISARGALRKLLGAYLEASPETIEFSTRHYGKPFILRDDKGLRFNLSHSNGIGVVAIAFNREVGVDVEYVDPSFDALSLAATTFSPTENSRLQALPQALQPGAFFSGWTRKEAFLKALGDGLSAPDIIQKALPLTSDCIFAYKAFESDEVSDWTVTAFEVYEGFKAAFAVEGKIETVRCLQMGNLGLE